MYMNKWQQKLSKAKPKGFTMSDELKREIFNYAKCGTRSYLELRPFFPESCTERSVRAHLQRMGIRLRKMDANEIKIWKSEEHRLSA